MLDERRPLLTMASSSVSSPQVAHVNCTAWPFLELDSDVTGIGVSTVLIRLPHKRVPLDFLSLHLYAMLTKDGSRCLNRLFSVSSSLLI